jgi:37-kD nucleoid-associated bacterial protein
MLGEQDALVGESRAIASYLAETQPSISPGGIVVVANCSLNGEQAVLIAKLEHELGVRAHQMELADGSRTFDVELLKDLLFTGNSKVFKVAVMLGSATQAPLAGHLVDTQAAGYGVAQYFLMDFLGCELTQRADRLTEVFFEATEKWLNRQTDSQKRGRYQLSLMSEMLSNTTDVAVDEFASRYLDVEDRDDFSSTVYSQGAPEGSFPKDTSLVESRLSQIRIDTASGVLLAAPRVLYEDGTVLVEDLDDGRARIIVTDRVTRISGRRGRKLVGDDGADVW